MPGSMQLKRHVVRKSNPVGAGGQVASAIHMGVAGTLRGGRNSSGSSPVGGMVGHPAVPRSAVVATRPRATVIRRAGAVAAVRPSAAAVRHVGAVASLANGLGGEAAARMAAQKAREAADRSAVRVAAPATPVFTRPAATALRTAPVVPSVTDAGLDYRGQPEYQQGLADLQRSSADSLAELRKQHASMSSLYTQGNNDLGRWLSSDSEGNNAALAARGVFQSGQRVVDDVNRGRTFGERSAALTDQSGPARLAGEVADLNRDNAYQVEQFDRGARNSYDEWRRAQPIAESDVPVGDGGVPVPEWANGVGGTAGERMAAQKAREAAARSAVVKPKPKPKAKAKAPVKKVKR